MSERHGGGESELLVATDDQSFGGAVVDAVEGTEASASAEHVEPVTGELTGNGTEGVEGVIVDGQIAEPAGVVERLTGNADLPVVVLADSTGDDDTITDVIRAGATDVFPRTTTGTQYELAVERLVSEDSPAHTRALSEEDTTHRQAYEALFEKISEGLVVHDPETGEIVDVNERFCEMNGYERSELLGESIGMVLTEEEAYGPEAAREMIQRARTEGPQQFEWRNQRRNGETFPVEVDLTVIELGDTERVLASVQDITERKRREQEYEQIFNGVNESITIHDPETGELLNVNEAFCELVGHDRETILESGVMEYTPSGEGYTVEEAKQFIREVVETGEPKRTEWAVETADGEIRQLEVTGTTVEIGGNLRYVAIDRDITERKRREREYEQIFNMAGDGIVIHDQDSGRVVDANQQVADLLGYDRETFFDRPMSEFQATDEGVSGQQAREKIRESAEAGGQEFEWPLEASDGETVWVRARHETGEIDGEQRIVAILQDITERKRREQEYEQIFNGVQDAIAVHDPETGEMIEVNDKFCELVGYDRETVLELGTEGVSVEGRGDTMERSEAIIEEVMDNGEMDPFEWKVETSEGEHRIIEVVATTAEIGGETRLLSINRDITERKRREQRLEVFNRILRHNLRNRLDVIRSHAEELADRTADDHASRIIDAVSQLAAIGRRARQIDRIMSRDETLMETDVTETLRETVRAMEPTRSDVTMRTEFPEEAHLWTDEETVTLAVESALENALEHAASAVTVAIETHPEECVITISDDGPGIPEKALVPIEAGEETTLQHGRGLGLWQLRWSVNKLNGKLSFETGTGTTVRITLPDRRG